MSAPKVGIGLPVFNGANYVREAVESVLAQTFGDLELVISDNGSTDATPEICREFARRDARVQYHRQDRNRGAAWNFNQTFALARGQYFKWLAHDDVIGPAFLTRTIEVLDRDPGCVLCHTQTGVINESGELALDSDADRETSLHVQGTTPERESQRLSKLSSSAPHQRLLGVLFHSVRCYEVFGLVRADVMRRTRLHRPYLSGEKVFLAELSLLGTFQDVPQVLSFNRWHANRFSANASARDQSLHMDPNAMRRLRVPRQLRSTAGYMDCIVRADLSAAERAKCLFVLGRFVMQTKKWRQIVLDYSHGVGQTAKLPESSTEAATPVERRHWTSLSDICSKGAV